MAVWFGGGDWLETVNLAFQAADFTDADCNAANAGAVVGAMKGTSGLPRWLIDRLGDRITGDQIGGVKLTPPVDESLTALASRTAAIGRQFVAANGARYIRRGLHSGPAAGGAGSRTLSARRPHAVLESRLDAAARGGWRRRRRHERHSWQHSSRWRRSGDVSARRGARSRLDAQGQVGRRTEASSRRCRRRRPCVGPRCPCRQPKDDDPHGAGKERTASGRTWRPT